MSTINKPAIVLCGDWFDAEESTQLVRAPKITIDPTSGQLYAAVGDEKPEVVIETETSHMHQTISIRTAAGETFVCSLKDYPMLPGQDKVYRHTARALLTSPTSCVVCGAQFDQPVTGRTRRYCSDLCRQHASRKRRKQRKAVSE